MNKPTFKHICLMHIQQLTNFPYIEKDFDALTDYGLLCKVVDYLNQVIASENAQNENILALYNAFTELKNYVENYFDNLDVQDEINNKLNEMAEDGTLDQIIEQYLNSSAIWGFDTVADMKKATNLINGSYAKTLGYYSINDGGMSTYKIREVTNQDVINESTIIALNDINLVAELIIEDDTVNIKQFGAKDNDYTFDNGIVINKALEIANIVFIPSGTFFVNTKINLPFNKTLEGINNEKTILSIGENLENDFCLTYGTSYSYGDKQGLLKNIRFSSSNNSKHLSYGIKVFSGIRIENCMFYGLKRVIKQDNAYIDRLQLVNCSINYCNDNTSYVVDLFGNKDQLLISNLMYNDDYTDTSDTASPNYFTPYRGIRISGATSGLIENCVINNNLIIDNTLGLSINNCHFEGSQNGTYKGNKASITINKSNVTLNDCYMHKRIDGANIVIARENNNENSHSIIELKNITFVINDNIKALTQNASYTNYEIEKSTYTTLVINGCYKNVDFSATWSNTKSMNGIYIKDNSEFNKHSSLYSISSIVNDNNLVTTNIPRTSSTITNENLFINSGVNNKIPFYQAGFSNTPQTIKGIVVIDETRKLALSTGATQTLNVTSSVNNTGGTGININFNRIKMQGIGATLFYYRGNSEGNYNKLTKIPVLNCQHLYDMGNNVSGYITEDRETGDVDSFTYIKGYSTNGENVTFFSTSTPSYGTFTKGDRCINSNISTGNVKSWIYNGTNWIATGTYA